LYGEVFPEPQALTTRVPRVPGTDGRKMSKSYGNAVNLGDPLPETRQKILKMVTDPARKTRKDPGNPDLCPVYDLHKAFSDRVTLDLVNVECRRAGIGCIDCKNHLLKHLEPVLSPIQERRARLMNDRERVRAVLADGARRAGAEAAETMKRVRAAMRIDTRPSP
jgi:tryptophanyl-tRNA synthetase